MKPFALVPLLLAALLLPSSASAQFPRPVEQKALLTVLRNTRATVGDHGKITVDPRRIPHHRRKSSMMEWRSRWNDFDGLLPPSIETVETSIICPGTEYELHLCYLSRGAAAHVALSSAVMSGARDAIVRVRIYTLDPHARPGYSGVSTVVQDVFLSARQGRWSVDRIATVLTAH